MRRACSSPCSCWRGARRCSGPRTRPGSSSSCSTAIRSCVPRSWCCPAPGLDSVRAIVERDLDYSDRFELIPLPGPMEAPGPNGVNWAPYRAMNVVLAVDLQRSGDRILVRLWGVTSGQIQQQTTMPVETGGHRRGAARHPPDERRDRPLDHRLPRNRRHAVSYMSATTGSGGSTATGTATPPSPPPARTAYSPAWAPDGKPLRVHRIPGREVGHRPADVRDRHPHHLSDHGDDGEHHAGVLAGRVAARLQPDRNRSELRDPPGQRSRSLLRRTTDGDAVCRKPAAYLFSRRTAHRVHHDARGRAADLRDVE